MPEKRNDHKKPTPPSPVCRMEGHCIARGHWHAAATTTCASYMLKTRSELSWLVPWLLLTRRRGSCNRCCNLCACAHTSWAGGGATLRGGVVFLRIHMRTLDHPRILVQRNKGMMTLMRENSQRAGARVDNFQFTPRLFSGNVGAGRVALE